jgi:hypothetical protein
VTATRAEAAQKAAHWAGQADLLDAEACRVMESAPDPFPGSSVYAALREEAARCKAQADALRARRDEAIRLANMWTGVATAIDGTEQP